MNITRRKEAMPDPLRIGITAIVLILFFVLSAGLGDGCRAAQAKADDIVATWDHHVITKADLELRIKSLPPQAQMQLQSPEMKREFLESLIQIRIVGAEARLQKLNKDKKVVARIQDLTDSVLLQEYINKKLVDFKKPSEKDIEAYYQANKAEFMVPAMVKAQHILIKTDPKMTPEAEAAAKAKAEGILKEIQAGGDFGKLAEKYSDDEGSKGQGGDLGQFSREQMVPEFSEAAFSLKKGEVSQLVKTQFGFHIIKVTDIIPGKQMELKEAQNTIATKLDNQNREKFIMGELDRLKKKYKVKINMPEPSKSAPQDKKE